MRDAGATADVLPAAPLSVLAEGEVEPGRIAVDERYVYWAARAGLRRAPLGGGQATSLVQDASPWRVVAAAGYVFFSDRQAGTVTRVARDTGEMLSVGHGVAPDAIAVRDGRVYWTDAGSGAADGSIASAALDGSDARIELSGLMQPAGLALSDDAIYFSSTSSQCTAPTPGASGSTGCVGGGVSRVPRAGGTPMLLGDHTTATDVLLGSRGAYWIVESPTRVLFAAFSGRGASELAKLPDAMPPGPYTLQDDVLYVAAADAGRVVKLALDSAASVPIAVDLGPIGGVAADRSWLYVTQSKLGRVLRVAQDGSAAQPTAPVTGPCPMPLGTAQEIASTPRQDENLELLALRLDADRVVATQESYERVLADVAALRSLAPTFADIGFFARQDGRHLMLEANDSAFLSISRGEYHAWDCLNTHYVLQDQALMRVFSRGYVTLSFKGLYNLELLAGLYKQLTGIVSVETTSLGGDGSKLCALRHGDELEYVADRGGGDCPAGCTEHDAQRFVSSRAGVVEARESWNSASGAPRPDWFTRACSP